MKNFGFPGIASAIAIIIILFMPILLALGFATKYESMLDEVSNELPAIDEVVLKIQEYDKQVASIPPSEEIAEINNEIAKLSFIVSELCPNERMFSENTCYFFITREKANTANVDGKYRINTNLYHNQKQKVSDILFVFNEKHNISVPQSVDFTSLYKRVLLWIVLKNTECWI